jgi:hypothetical protein
MNTNGRENKEKQSNRRLTQIHADKFLKISQCDFYGTYLRTSALICGSLSFLRVHSWSILGFIRLSLRSGNRNHVPPEDRP